MMMNERIAEGMNILDQCLSFLQAPIECRIYRRRIDGDVEGI